MTKLAINEIEFQLRKLITRYSDFFAYHQWPSEHERWVELIFALVTRISKKPESEIRYIVEELDDIGLLDIEELSNVQKAGNDIDFNSPFAKRVFESLLESRLIGDGSTMSGFTREESKSSLLVISEAAKSLTENSDGKIQKYLRKYGQQMVDEFSDSFSFSGIDKKDLENAITYWLQNVLNMPIHLKTESIDTFCKDHQISNEELVNVADSLDINIALLDDMIDQYIRSAEKEVSRNG